MFTRPHHSPTEIPSDCKEAGACISFNPRLSALSVTTKSQIYNLRISTGEEMENILIKISDHTACNVFVIFLHASTAFTKISA